MSLTLFDSRQPENPLSYNHPQTGRAGGALTAAMLHVTYADEQDTAKDLTFKEVLMAIREKLEKKGFSQIPQLSSSRQTNLDEKFTIIPDDFSGTRRAVMIGINYVGHDPGELRGCHNDVHNVSIIPMLEANGVFCVWRMILPFLSSSFFFG